MFSHRRSARIHPTSKSTSKSKSKSKSASKQKSKISPFDLKKYLPRIKKQTRRRNNIKNALLKERLLEDMKDKFQKKNKLQKILQEEQSENNLRILKSSNIWNPRPIQDHTQKYTNDY